MDQAGMHHFWFFPFWLIVPLIGLGFGFYAMWLRHRREIVKLELLRTYAAQGKEPPAEIATILQNGGLVRHRRERDFRRAIFFGSLAVAFAIIAYFGGGGRPYHGFVIGAVILGALAVGSAATGWLQRRHDEP